MGHRKRDDRMSRKLSQLISMLVRYPEVGTVTYDPGQQTIRMSLLLKGEMAGPEFAVVEEALFDTLEVYHLLEQRQPVIMEVVRESYGGLTSIAITRDARSLSPEEIYVLIEFFRQRFPGRLVAEAVEYAGEDDLIAQDEMIEEILYDLEATKGDRNLIAIREDGRLMVFQK